MDSSAALAGLAALAQGTRLKVFRALIRRGPEGVAAGQIARNLKLPIIYSVDPEGTRDLLTFLVKDCCRGNPAACEPLIAY